MTDTTLDLTRTPDLDLRAAMRAFKRARGKSPAHWRAEPDLTAEAQLK